MAIAERSVLFSVSDDLIVFVVSDAHPDVGVLGLVRRCLHPHRVNFFDRQSARTVERGFPEDEERFAVEEGETRTVVE